VKNGLELSEDTVVLEDRIPGDMQLQGTA